MYSTDGHSNHVNNRGCNAVICHLAAVAVQHHTASNKGKRYEQKVSSHAAVCVSLCLFHRLLWAFQTTLGCMTVSIYTVCVCVCV